MVYVEAAVQVRVVDEALPADCRARLLKVGAHHHDKTVLPALFVRCVQLACIVLCLFDIVDRARAHHDEQAIVLAVDHVGDVEAAACDRLLGLFCHRLLMHKHGGSNKRVVARHTGVIGVDWLHDKDG